MINRKETLYKQQKQELQLLLDIFSDSSADVNSFQTKHKAWLKCVAERASEYSTDELFDCYVFRNHWQDLRYKAICGIRANFVVKRDCGLIGVLLEQYDKLNQITKKYTCDLIEEQDRIVTERHLYELMSSSNNTGRILAAGSSVNSYLKPVRSDKTSSFDSDDDMMFTSQPKNPGSQYARPRVSDTPRSSQRPRGNALSSFKILAAVIVGSAAIGFPAAIYFKLPVALSLGISMPPLALVVFSVVGTILLLVAARQMLMKACAPTRQDNGETSSCCQRVRLGTLFSSNKPVRVDDSKQFDDDSDSDERYGLI